MTQRFKVGSLTGYVITAASNGGGGSKEKTYWYVLDSANCYRQVGETYYEGEEHLARAYADRLNALDLTKPVEPFVAA